MYIIIILLLIPIVYLVYHYYVHYGPSGRLLNNIPGPRSYPIIGNLELMDSIENIWNYYVNATNTYYPVFKIWGFCSFVVSISHPDDIEVILSNIKYINKSKQYDAITSWIGTGLLTSEGSKWQFRRKLLTPAFSFNILQQFVEILVERSENLTKSLKSTGGIVTKDLIPLMNEQALNIMCETIMGISVERLSSDRQQFVDIIYKTNQNIIYRIMRPWLTNDWVFSLTSKGKEQEKFLKISYEFIEKIIEERKVCHKQTNGQYLRTFNEGAVAEAEDTGSMQFRKKRLILLDLLISASQEGLLTDLDVKQEVATFIIAGYDTTSMSMCFVLSLLAEHKDIQDRVRKEADAVIQKNRGKLTMKSLQDLQYLERCIKETLRLYPPVCFVSRSISENIQLKSNPYIIPARTPININTYGVHRDPNFWPNPEIFDPDRFLPENIQNRHPYSYIPFSAGPRNCIGKRFAMLSMKAMIVSLIHNFYLKPVDYLKDLQLGAGIMIHSVHPLRIKFIPIATK